MTFAASWPVASILATQRLSVEPLRVDDADELAPLLDDGRLHTFTGGQPATAEQLRSRYAHQVVGHSVDGTQGWCNWVLRTRESGVAVGTVQATIKAEGPAMTAEVAWVVGTAYQGRGYARECAAAMVAWLRSRGVATIAAHIHPEHHASAAVASSLGLSPTDVVVDGEIRWE